MLKTEELADPNSCINKAANDEPVFVLRAHDPVFSKVVRFWVMERVLIGKNTIEDPEIIEANELQRYVDANKGKW